MYRLFYEGRGDISFTGRLHAGRDDIINVSSDSSEQGTFMISVAIKLMSPRPDYDN